jgi:DNA-binding response OmpR family regulator
MPRSPESRRAARGAASDPRPTVLVVDDNAAVREMLGDILASNFDVRLAGDSRQALERFEAELVDVVLLDILMPGVDGLEVLSRLRAMKPDVPVIVVSGLDRAAPATNALCLGARDYLTKPVDAALLLSTVSSAVHGATPKAAPLDVPGQMNPWPSRADVVLLGDDIPALAGIKVALMPLPARVVSVTVVGLQHLTAGQPAFVLIEEPPSAEEAISAVRAARNAAPRCKLALGCDVTKGRGSTDERLKQALSREVDVFLSKPYDLNEIRAWVTVALGRERDAAYRGPLGAHVVRALHYVAQHYGSATLEAAAGAAKVSPGYLAHVFRAELDTTFWDCVTTVRLEVAKDLLARTSHKLARIAELAGFCDAPHLSRVFSRYCGCSPRCSPRAYRNKMLRFSGSDRIAAEPIA